MISIVISSKSQTLLNNVAKNISDTIGIEYEIIAVDNSKGEFGICEAYNRGAAKAKFDHLCFSHEDVVYHTQDWGKNLIAHLADPEVGVIGVCGSLVKPKSPSGVWLNNDAADRLSMYQTDSNGKPYHVFGNPDRETISEVKTLDGVFLCCRKEVWKKNKFDQDNLKNFHGYDVDFSLQVSQSYKNYVVYDIQLEHFSYGTNTPAWVESVVAIEKKWSDTLPSFTKGFDPKMINTIEHYSLGYFLTAVIENKLVSKKYLSYYLRMIKQKPLDRANFRLLRLYWRTRKKNIGKVG